MRLQPLRNAQKLSLDIHPIIPKPFCQDTGSNPNLLLMGVAIAELAPHAGLSTDHLHTRHPRLELVYVPPLAVAPVSHAVAVAKALVNVDDVLGREDDFVGLAGQSVDIGTLAPPLQHVIVLKWQIQILISPVYSLFGGSNLSPE
jgi:hypothetical protein